MAEPGTKEMPSSAGVRVRNLLRRRAVLVNLPGGTSLRLGPGEAASMTEQQARSRECARFCRDGVLRIETASAAPAEPRTMAASAEEAPPADEPMAVSLIEVTDDVAGKSDDEVRGERPPGVEDADADSSEPSESKPMKAGAKADSKPPSRRKDSADPKGDEKPPRGRKGKGDDSD